MRNSSTSKTILVSHPASRLIRPVGCPGGRFIVFVWTNHNGNKKTNIWRVDIDGSNPKQLTSGEIDVAGTCSLGEKWVYYQTYDSLRAFRVSIDGGTPEEVPGSQRCWWITSVIRRGPYFPSLRNQEQENRSTLMCIFRPSRLRGAEDETFLTLWRLRGAEGETF